MNTKSQNNSLAGLGVQERKVLGKLLRHGNVVIGLDTASEILGFSTEKTAKILSRLTQKGWLARVRRGLYIPIALEARSSEGWPEDPWVLGYQAFSPCYIGGWSAAEYWDLTEQIFRTTCIMTSHPTRKKELQLLGIPYRIKTLKPRKFFGTKKVWRGSVQILISDPEKTLIDAFDDPSIGGGARAMVDMVKAYWRKDKIDLAKIFRYASKMENGALFKRLGYVAEEIMNAPSDFLDECRTSLTTGNAVLDPNIKAKGRLVRRWRLWVNVDVGR